MKLSFHFIHIYMVKAYIKCYRDILWWLFGYGDYIFCYCYCDLNRIPLSCLIVWMMEWSERNASDEDEWEWKNCITVYHQDIQLT